MKKFLIPCLAVIAVAAIVFCFVFNGQKGDLQKQLDEAKAEVTKATDNAKAEVEKAAADAKAEAEAKITDLEGQLTEAKKAAEDAKAEAEAKIADLEGQLTEAKKAAEEAQAKIAELEEKLAAATAGAAVEEKPVDEKAVEEKPAEEKPADTAEEKPAEEKSADTAEEKPAEEVKVMTHEEYMAAEMDSEVVIESYVQDHQAWWDNKVTVYLQSPDGAYFAYEMVCSEEDAAKLVKGQKIRVKGYKTEWSGEVEIASGCTFEFVEGDSFIAEAEDVTALLASEDLIKHMNEFVAVKGATIVAQESGEAFSYKNPEEKNDDLYFAVDVNGATYNFCVEKYLRDESTDVYKAVEGLKVGDVVDIEGFLYWYNGANLQATSVTVK